MPLRPRRPPPASGAKRPSDSVADRHLTPHELHQKAVSVLDQLDRIAVSWRAGTVPSAREVDVVTRAAAELRRRIEDARERLHDAGPTALHHLSAARALVARAIELVDDLAAEHPGDVSRTATGRPPRAASEAPPNGG